MNSKWYFNKKTGQQRSLSDSITTDSKFNLNPFASFTREIIQNSIDAVLDENKPVEITFSLQAIKRELIPGIEDLLYVIDRCIESITHKDTKNKYIRGRERLLEEEVLCLKISDYNTCGMDEKQFDALLNIEGSSVKRSSGSAGSHGVGKKASFLMSLCNTVFYSTKNIKNELRFQGKSVLTDWKDKEQWYSREGWFGEQDRKNALDGNIFIKPIDPRLGDSGIHDYFLRTDETGTDVIIVALIEKTEGLNKNIDLIAKEITLSVLENFFWGILESKIKVNIIGGENNLTIDKQSFDYTLRKYYDQTFKKSDTGINNIVFGLLPDYYNAYNKNQLSKIKMLDFGEDNFIHIYFDEESSKSKKYYCFFRSHGMKILDFQLSKADTYFTAVVIAIGKELNSFLSDLENAAHDNFIIDNNAPDYKDKKEKLNGIFHRIESFLVNQTKLEIKDEYDVDAINDMIDIVGELKAKTSKKKATTAPPKLKSLKTRKKRATVKIEYEDDGPGHKTEKKVKTPDKNQKKYNIEDPDSTKESDVSAKEIIANQSMVMFKNGYITKLTTDVDVKNAFITVYAKNNDGKNVLIGYALENIIINGKNYMYNESGEVSVGDIFSQVPLEVFVTLNNDYKYKLNLRVIGEEL